MVLLNIFIFLFGLIIGSFLNVLIYRLPIRQNWIYQRSFCPNCKTQIPFYRNIPLLSFFLQRGRCHNCSQKISYQYPMIEFFLGVVFVFLFPKNISIPNMVNYFFLISIFSAFVVHFIIDIRHHILPDEINIYLAALFVLYGLYYFSFLYVIVGGFVGFFIPYFVAYVFYKYKGVEGLGGGDIKLFGALGFYLGPQGIMTNIFLSCFLGSAIGVLLIFLGKLDKNKPLAFGPFIIISAFFQIFFPEQMSQLRLYIGF